jgi:alkylation response protein AidB-like acyl-CoA dehydrogenase
MRAVLTSEQEMLRDTAAGLASSVRVNTPGDLPRVDRDKGWSALARAGLLAMRARGDDGAPLGSGFDTALVAQALGGALAPLPFVGALLAYELLVLAGAPDEWLADLGEGSVRYGLLLTRELDGLADADAPEGAVCVDAEGAEYVLALARGREGLRVVRLKPADEGAPQGVDLTRPFRPWRAATAERDVAGALSPSDLERWTALALSLVCADLVGVLRAGLAQVVEYSRTRVQYGVPIGSFQAVQHMCADMLVQTEAAASATNYAAWAVDALDPAESLMAARTAKAYCGPVGQSVGETLMQAYGGIGQTWEHVAHLRTRRAMADRKLFGDESSQLLHIADARLGQG